MIRIFIGALLALMLAASAPAMAQQNLGTNVVQANGLTTTPVSIKATKGQVAFYSCANANASLVYLQFFDTTGTVTPGTTVPRMALAVKASDVSGLYVNVNFYKAIQVIAATTPTGAVAPGTPLNCAIGVF